MLKTLLIGAFGLSSVVLVAETANRDELSGLEETSPSYKESVSDASKRANERDNSIDGRITAAGRVTEYRGKVKEYQEQVDKLQIEIRRLETKSSRSPTDNQDLATFEQQKKVAEDARDAAKRAQERAEAALASANKPSDDSKAKDARADEVKAEVAKLKQQLDNLNLSMKLSALEGKKLETDVRLEGLERRADQLFVGGYVREKFARLLSDASACKAISRCAAGPPPSRSEVNEQLNEVFFNSEGTLGRSREDGSKKAAPKSHQ